VEHGTRRGLLKSGPRRLRIAVILKTSTGGLWILPQVEEFRARGHQVVIVLPAGPGRLRAALAERGFHVIDSPFDFAFRPRLATLRALWRFRRLLRELRPDVIHYHLYASAMVGRLTALGMSALKVHMVPGPLFLESPVIRRVERLLWRLDDLTVCGTDFTSRLYGDLGCPAERRPVVTYGVDTTRFSVANVVGEGTQAAVRGKVRADLGIDQDAFLVVMIAFAYPPRGLVHRGRGIKGHDVLLDAWSRFHPRSPGAHLLLAGGGWTPAGEEYRDDLIRTFDVVTRPDVTWEDYVPDVRALYAAADLSVSPSLSDGHGAVPEASAMGVPSIVSDAGGLPETVDESGGWVVPRDDPARLAAALDTAYREFATEGLAARGASARRRSVRLFDNAAAAKRLADLIERASSQIDGNGRTTGKSGRQGGKGPVAPAETGKGAWSD
jgi:glycosyltransferase involved in cell wall biosynthesis